MAVDRGVATKGAGACVFCDVIALRVNSHMVYEDEVAVAILDASPLFKGHTLLLPRSHTEDLYALGEGSAARYFADLRTLSRAVQTAMGADGTFVALNNRVSQSVPHMHFHIVPRRFNDGLRGFFWPRTSYASEAEADEVAGRIRRAAMELAAGRT